MLGIWPDPQERAKLIVRLRSEGSVRNIELSMRMKSGELRHFLISTDLITLQGTPCLLTIGDDITERKRAEEALRQLNETLEQRVAERTAALRTVQARQQVLLTATPVVLYACRASGDYGTTFISENVVKQLGYSPQDFADHPTFRIEHIHPDDRAYVLAGLSRVVEHGRHIHEYRFRHQDGRYRWLRDEVRLLRDGAGVTVELIGFQVDVSEQKRGNEVLREGEERFRTFLNNASNLAWMKDRDGRYLYANRRFEEAFQLDQKDILGKKDTDLFPREQAEQFQGNDRCVLETGKGEEFEEVSQDADGLHTNIVVKFPVRDGSGRVYAIGGIAIDITDRKKVERALQLSQTELRAQQAQLQELNAKLLTAQEQERKRIARDLHDDVTQRLAALTIDLQCMSVQASRSDASQFRPLKELGDQAEQLTTDLQRLAHQLHPSLLDHVGLEAAFREQVEEFAGRTGLTAELLVRNVPIPIPLEQATCLYRVLQESLQNVRKHAEATNVFVRLLKMNGGLSLCVYDDGRGFEPSQDATELKGLGLTSMAERVKALRGTFHVRSKAGNGTEVHAWVPLPGATGDSWHGPYP